MDRVTRPPVGLSASPVCLLRTRPILRLVCALLLSCLQAGLAVKLRLSPAPPCNILGVFSAALDTGIFISSPV